jgi:hypothetical protein
MASRKEIYEKLESIEGGESIRDALKELFQADDTKLQETVDALKSTKGDMAKLSEEFEGLKAASSETVPKTEMEKAIADMQKTLKGITEERDAEKAINEKNAAEKKQSALEKHFFDSVAEPFGAVGAGDAVTVSRSKMGYTEDGEISYSGKVGDEAVELFRTDNSRFMPNKGTYTNGGNNEPSSNGFVDSLRAQMLRD